MQSPCRHCRARTSKIGPITLSLASMTALWSCSDSHTTNVEVSRQALGASYYVATTGNDTDPLGGSSTHPWRTIQKAVDAVGVGDTILVRPGSYAGFRIGKSGTQTSRNVIKAENPDSRPVITSPGPVNVHSSSIELEKFDDIVSDWTIDGFEVSNAPSGGIDLRHTDRVIVRNCYVHNSGSGNFRNKTGVFSAFSDHLLIENNVSASNPEHGFYLSNSGDFATVRNNISHHNASSGIQFNADRSQDYPDGHKDGRMVSNLIEKNVIYENGLAGAAALNMDGLFDSTIQNNLLYDNHATGISLHGLDAPGSSNNKVYNNTVIQASDAIARWAFSARKEFDDPTVCSECGPQNNVLENNIFLNPGPRGAIDVWDPSALSASDYNVVKDMFNKDDGNTSNITLAQWRALTGFDTHSVISDPAAVFVNPSANDYHLAAASPALNMGVNLAPEVVTDLEGRSRPQGTGYDVGAYETPSSGGGGGSCVQGGTGSWTGAAFPVQAGSFSAQFDASVTVAPTNAVIGLSSGVQNAYTGFAGLVRFFNSPARIEARNGNAYVALTNVPYSANTNYHFRMVVNVSTHTYSVYVTPQGGAEQALGVNMLFRTEQNAIGQLDHYGAHVDDVDGTGSVQVCNFSVLQALCLHGTTSGWVNTTFGNQTGTFTAQFDAVVSAAPTNAVIALANGAPSDYAGFATLVRFSDNPVRIEARNGGVYQANTTIPYSPNSNYHFRLVVNVGTRLYSAFVTPPGGSEQVIGSNLAFRTEQSMVTQLNDFGARVDASLGTGSVDACSLSLQ
jgi:parallel beta-helix repeat protein